MNRIIRWYNKNRKIFWIAIVILIMAVSIPRALNKYAKDKENVSSSINNATTYNNQNYLVITEEELKEETGKENTNIINNFIEYCNTQNPEEAYKILSEQCKEELYPTLNDFIEKYYNKIFKSRKSYEMQAWILEEDNYTYKVNLKEDILSTGNVNSASIEDYYTIVYEDNSYKLNINNYIGNAEINSFKENEELGISVLSKDVFMEYEIYNISVESKNGKSILVDSLETTEGMYLEDSEGLTYKAYSHEIIHEKLRVRGEKNISIKFNKKYSTQREIKRIVFSDIILDYDNYDKYINKSEFKNRTMLEIEL